MGEARDILTILSEAAPLWLSVIILAVVLVLILYAFIRVVIPAMQATVQQFTAIRASYDELIERSERLASREVAEMRQSLDREIEKREAVEAKLAAMQAEISQRDERLAEAQACIVDLEQREQQRAAADAERLAELRKVQAEVSELQAQNKSLQTQLAAVEADREKTATERDAAEKENEKLRERVSELQSTSQQQGQRIKDLEQQVNSLKRELEAERADGSTARPTDAGKAES